VIPTAESAGHLMGLSLVSPVAGEIMEDLLDATRGLNIVERDITREELGISPSRLDESGQLVLAVVRSGRVFRFEEQLDVLQRGDRLVVIRAEASR
ncbi:MAG: Ion channel protein, partial [Actinomycetota bacterium]|nr:Ion channel protein [Actinomycetota bacterium]